MTINSTAPVAIHSWLLIANRVGHDRGQYGIWAGQLTKLKYFWERWLLCTRTCPGFVRGYWTNIYPGVACAVRVPHGTRDGPVRGSPPFGTLVCMTISQQSSSHLDDQVATNFVSLGWRWSQPVDYPQPPAILCKRSLFKGIRHQKYPT